MSRIAPTAELRAGMTLAAPVHDRSGRLLIPAGMTLQDKHLRVLRAWGVSEVRIQDGDPPATEPVPDAAEGTQPTAGERIRMPPRRALAPLRTKRWRNASSTATSSAFRWTGSTASRDVR